MAVTVENWYARLPTSWFPKTAAQKAALACDASFLMFGGAAGSLKSSTLLVAAAQQIDKPKYRAIIFRRTLPEIRFLKDRSIEMYTQMGAFQKDFNQASGLWKFPSGAQIEFKYLDADNDVYKYQGQEYQFIGFDESTHFLEAQIRYLVNSRMRSTDPSIRMQAFLATNPGNRGHNYHKEIFIGPRCIHCLALEKRGAIPGTKIPGRIYTDALWPSDKRKIGLSTVFIPGRVTDHSLLGQEYIDKLEGMSTAMRDALLNGCWEAFEGQYFDVWDANIHVVPHQSIIEKYKPWWTSWTGTDYGFGHAGVSYLFHKDGDGMTYVSQEMVEHRLSVGNFSLKHRDLWKEKYRPAAWFLSPECVDTHSGDTDFTRAELMTNASGVLYDRAINDRVAGWSQCYELLQQGRMVISDECKLLIAAIPSRVHGDGQVHGNAISKKEDVRKTEDDMDDAADAWRYGVASFMSAGRKSREQLISEAVTTSDPTGAMMQRLAAEAKYKNISAPTPYNRRARTK